mgnify:CR=1 FL=1
MILIPNLNVWSWISCSCACSFWLLLSSREWLEELLWMIVVISGWIVWCIYIAWISSHDNMLRLTFKMDFWSLIPSRRSTRVLISIWLNLFFAFFYLHRGMCFIHYFHLNILIIFLSLNLFLIHHTVGCCWLHVLMLFHLRVVSFLSWELIIVFYRRIYLHLIRSGNLSRQVGFDTYQKLVSPTKD